MRGGRWFDRLIDRAGRRGPAAGVGDLAEMRHAVADLSSSLADISKRLARLETSSREQTALYARQTAALRLGVDAVLRRLILSPDRLPPPHNLWSQRFRMWSQNEEDGIVLAIVTAAGISTGRFLELGAGRNGGNSGFLAAELGWTGTFVEADADTAADLRRLLPDADVTVRESWVTRENVNDLVRDATADGELDTLGIDIDGNDYWIWEAVEARPALVVVEFNPDLGDRPVAVPYDATFDRHSKPGRYYGASLQALCALAGGKGYRLVAVEPTSVNAFFVRDDVAPTLAAVDPALVYPPREKNVRRLGLGREQLARVHGRAEKPVLTRAERVDQLRALIEQEGLALVDVGSAQSDRS